MKLWLSLFLIIGGSVFAGSIRIMNDTAYALVAEVSSADGNKKGSVTIAPHGNATWQDSEGGSYAWSQTPYQVTLICQKSGKQYGIIDGVQQAATIQASMASGPRICKEDKKKDQNQPGQQQQQQGGSSNWGPPPDGTPSWEHQEPPGDPNYGPP